MALSAEDKQEIAGIVAESLKAPLESMRAETNKSISGALTAQLKKLDFKSQIDARLEEIAKESEDADDDDNEETTTAAGTAPAKVAMKVTDAPEFKGLQKQLAALQKQNEEAKAERDAAKQREKDSTLRTRVGDELAKNGFDAARIRHVMALLVDGEKRVKYSDDGESLSFRDDDGTDVDLATGLKSWSKGDDAKVYLSPRSTKGSGGQGGKTEGGGNGQRAPVRGEVARALLSMVGEAPLGE